jgi:hypothetical protein
MTMLLICKDVVRCQEYGYHHTQKYKTKYMSKGVNNIHASHCWNLYETVKLNTVLNESKHIWKELLF